MECLFPKFYDYYYSNLDTIRFQFISKIFNSQIDKPVKYMNVREAKTILKQKGRIIQ